MEHKIRGPASREEALVSQLIAGLRTLQQNKELVPYLSTPHKLVSQDCPFATQPILEAVRPNFSHQCTSTLREIHLRNSTDADWAMHVLNEHGQVHRELLAQAMLWASASHCDGNPKCPLGCPHVSESKNQNLMRWGPVMLVECHLLAHHTLELQHALLVQEYLARTATHTDACPLPGCIHNIKRAVKAKANPPTHQQAAQQQPWPPKCKRPLTAEDWLLLKRPTALIKHVDVEVLCHEAWLEHLRASPAHARTFMLCAKHTVKRACRIFAGKPFNLASCCWEGGCDMQAVSVSALLAHHAHFHHQKAVQTDWEQVEEDHGSLVALTLGCPMPGCFFTSQCGSGFRRHMATHHPELVQATAYHMARLATHIHLDVYDDDVPEFLRGPIQQHGPGASDKMQRKHTATSQFGLEADAAKGGHQASSVRDKAAGVVTDSGFGLQAETRGARPASHQHTAIGTHNQFGFAEETAAMSHSTGAIGLVTDSRGPAGKPTTSNAHGLAVDIQNDRLHQAAATSSSKGESISTSMGTTHLQIETHSSRTSSATATAKFVLPPSRTRLVCNCPVLFDSNMQLVNGVWQPRAPAVKLHHNIHDTREQVQDHMTSEHVEVAAVVVAYACGAASRPMPPGQLCVFDTACSGVGFGPQLGACRTVGEQSECLRATVDHLLTFHAPHVLDAYHVGCMMASAARTESPPGQLACPFGCGAHQHAGVVRMGQPGKVQGPPGRGGRILSLVETVFGRGPEGFDGEDAGSAAVRPAGPDGGICSGYNDTSALLVHILQQHGHQVHGMAKRTYSVVESQQHRFAQMPPERDGDLPYLGVVDMQQHSKQKKEKKKKKKKDKKNNEHSTGSDKDKHRDSGRDEGQGGNDKQKQNESGGDSNWLNGKGKEEAEHKPGRDNYGVKGGAEGWEQDKAVQAAKHADQGMSNVKEGKVKRTTEAKQQEGSLSTADYVKYAKDNEGEKQLDKDVLKVDDKAKEKMKDAVAKASVTEKPTAGIASTGVAAKAPVSAAGSGSKRSSKSFKQSSNDNSSGGSDDSDESNSGSSLPQFDLKGADSSSSSSSSEGDSS